jgi:hypothetical protein
VVSLGRHGSYKSQSFPRKRESTSQTFGESLPSQSFPLPLVQIPALSPLGERVDRTGAVFSRGGPGEGVMSLRPFVLVQIPSLAPLSRSPTFVFSVRSHHEGDVAF